MPRLLCLHGHGTSASIFKSQTAAFRSKLGDDYQFDFVDAPFLSAGAPGINAIYQTQTYTWWRQSTPEEIRAAHRWVADYATRNGPYDAVCCFSQGCSLASTMALYRSMEEVLSHGDFYGEPPLPFGAAIFICGGVPLPALEDMGLPVSTRAHEINQSTGALLNGTAGRLAEFAANLKLIKRGVGLWDDNNDLLVHDPRQRPARSDVFGLDFTEFPASARIRIPTAHIYGSKDPRWPAAIQLAEFCDDRIEYDHGGGHDIPRSTEVSVKIADMLRQVVGRGMAKDTAVSFEKPADSKIGYMEVHVHECF